MIIMDIKIIIMGQKHIRKKIEEKINIFKEIMMDIQIKERKNII